MRILCCILAASAFMFMPPLATASELATMATLRGNTVVDADVISIGDLFHGAGPTADVPVAYAPAPGRTAVFDATWLARVARQHGINWRPQGKLDRVVIERRSTVVDATGLAFALRDELMLLGIAGTFEVELANPNLKIHVAAEMPPTVDVASLAVDDRTGRFVATVRVPAGDPQARSMKITGRVRAFTEIPMLAHDMRPGETIGADDVIWTRVNRDQVRDNMISDEAELIGFEPRRQLRADAPIRRGDLRTPLAVHKGATVTMIARTSTMTLTATGRALDSGARDDTVRVMNSRTKVVVEATVVGPERVVLALPERLTQTGGIGQ